MSIDTLGGSSAGTKVYSAKSAPGAISVPSGVYTATAEAEWVFTDSTGETVTIPAGTSTKNLPNGLSSIVYGNSPAISKASKGTVSSAITPLGLVFDGTKYVAANVSSKFIQTADGKSWTDFANLNGYATPTDGPYVVSTDRFSYNSGIYENQSVTITFSAPLQENDLILLFGVARDNGGSSTRSPFGSLSGYTQLRAGTGYSYNQWNLQYKVVGATPETSVTFTTNTGTHNPIYTATVIRKAKLVAGVPQFVKTDNGSTLDPGSVTANANSLAMVFAGMGNDGTAYTAVSTGYTTATNSTTNNARQLVIWKNTGVTATTTVEDPSAFTSGSTESINSTIAFQPQNAPDPISCLGGSASGFVAYNPLRNKFGLAASTPTAWDYDSTSVTITQNPVYVTETYGTYSTVATVTLGLPTGSKAGDTAYMFRYNASAPNTAEMLALGWKLEYNSAAYVYVWSRVLTAADITANNVSLYGAYSSSAYTLAALLIIRNAGLAEFSLSTGGGSNDSYDLAGRTMTANSLSIISASSRGNSVPQSVSVGPTGYTTIYSAIDVSGTYSMRAGLYRKTITTTGTEDPSTVSWSTSQTSNTPKDLLLMSVAPASTINISGIKNLNGSYFAYGAMFLTSPTGSAWTQAVPPIGTIKDMAYGNSTYVMVGASGAIATSTNGSSWTVRSVNGLTSDINTIEYADGMFAIGAANGSLYYSTDAITWTAGSVGVTTTAVTPSVIWQAVRSESSMQPVMSLDFPVGAKAGDKIYAVVRSGYTSSYIYNMAPNVLSSGWKLENSKVSSSFTSIISIYSKVVTGDSDVSFAVAGSNTNLINSTTYSSVGVQGIAAICIRGVDTATYPPVSFQDLTYSTATTVDAGSSLTIARPSFAIAFAFSNNYQYSAFPTGYTGLSTVNSTNPNAGIAYKYVTTTTEDPATFTITTAAAQVAGFFTVPVLSSTSTGTFVPRAIGYSKPNFVAFGEGGQISSLSTVDGKISSVTNTSVGSSNYLVAGEVGRRVFAIATSGEATYAGSPVENMTLTLVAETVKLNG